MSSSDAPTITPAATALLVMDFQNGVVSRIADPDGLVARAAEAIDLVRRAGGHIGYVRVGFTAEDKARVPSHHPFTAHLTQAGDALDHDHPATQVDSRIAPREGDMVVRKTRVGAFSTTDLAEQLDARGVDTLILAGISTSGVLLSTVRDAADRDYRLIVLSDVSADPHPETHAHLVEWVFPRQAQVLTLEQLRPLLTS